MTEKQLRRRRVSRPGDRTKRPIRGRFEAYRDSRPDREPTVPRKAAVPSFFTLMNLFSGFLAIIQVSEGRFTYAAWLIVLAGFFDLLDGLSARLTQGQSDFGIHLDSLSDVVSFGVAPSFLVFRFGLDQFGMPGLMIAALPAICGAVRLARFGTTANGVKQPYYDGLPIPVQASVIVTFILTFEDPSWFDSFKLGSLSVLIPMVVITSALMVTTIEFPAIPKLTASSLQKRPYTVTGFGLGLVLTLIFQAAGLFAVMIGYILVSVGRSIYTFVLAVWSAESDNK